MPQNCINPPTTQKFLVNPKPAPCTQHYISIKTPYKENKQAKRRNDKPRIKSHTTPSIRNIGNLHTWPNLYTVTIRRRWRRRRWRRAVKLFNQRERTTVQFHTLRPNILCTRPLRTYDTCTSTYIPGTLFFTHWPYQKGTPLVLLSSGGGTFTRHTSSCIPSLRKDTAGKID